MVFLDFEEIIYTIFHNHVSCKKNKLNPNKQSQRIYCKGIGPNILHIIHTINIMFHITTYTLYMIIMINLP